MFPHRLRLARKRAGLSLRDLAEKIDNEVSHQAIKKYEDGEMYPSSRVLVSLSRALGVSLDFLMSNQVEGLAEVEFRQHSGTTQKDRARIEAAVIEAVERYLEVENALGIEEEPVDFGTIDIARPIERLEEAEERANALRGRWQLGQDPIPSVTVLLEEKGFKVIEADLPDGVDGLTCSVQREGDKPPLAVIVVTKNQLSVERRRFTLMHELAHKVITQVAEGVKKEIAMHRFAGAFLVPGKHVEAEIGGVRRAFAYLELIRLKQLYGVSAASFLMRLRDLGMLSREAVELAFRTYARTWRKQEPNPIQLDEGLHFERPVRFQQLVYRALAEQMVSLPRAAELLNCPIADVEAAVKGPSARNADHPE